MELLFLVFAFHILSTLSVSALPGALQKRDLEKRQIPKPGKPFISGWVAAWLGQKSVELYQYYDELSFFSAVIDKTTLSVGWSIDGGPETVFPDNYIKDNYETQPILLTIGGWSGSMNVRAISTHCFLLLLNLNNFPVCSFLRQ